MTSASVANGAAHAKLKITGIMRHMQVRNSETPKQKTPLASPITILKTQTDKKPRYEGKNRERKKKPTQFFS